MYHYTYPRKGNVLQDILGDYHASELVLVFGNQWPPVLGTFSADDWAVSKSFGSFYANMAKSGNPNGPESLGISWPQYSKDSRVAISVTVPLSIEVNLGEDVCPFWDSFRD
jgi:carboxylesterase type B